MTTTRTAGMCIEQQGDGPAVILLHGLALIVSNGFTNADALAAEGERFSGIERAAKTDIQ